MGIKIEKALKKCRCQSCNKNILHNDWRVQWIYGFYHLQCFIDYSSEKIAEFRGHKKLLSTKHTKKLQEERGYRVLRAI